MDGELRGLTSTGARRPIGIDGGHVNVNTRVNQGLMLDGDQYVIFQLHGKQSVWLNKSD